MSGVKNISISPVIARNAFVDRRFDTGEIIFIPPISLPYLSRHHTLDTPESCYFCMRECGDHGRDDGREMGGMTGEMKLTETLCIKGFAASDGRDEGFFASLVKILSEESVPLGRAEE
jgi:hypothetical protein